MEETMANSVLKSNEYSLSPDYDTYAPMRDLIERLTWTKDGGLSDEELMDLHKFLFDVVQKLSGLGPYFNMARDKVMDLYLQAERYRYARIT
jgi:hypothetical protein